MLDDCANEWGRRLVDVADRMPGIPGIESQFKRVILTSLDHKFHCMKFCANGSDANHSAVTAATEGNFAACAFACGSYVAGDMSFLQTYSSAGFKLNGGPFPIMDPAEVPYEWTRNATFPLPYLIEGVMSNEEAEKYEDECLHNVHCRLCVAKALGRPFKALFLEFILASNGGMLRSRALGLLGKLARHHQIKLIVDEVFTGARTGQLLMTLSSPQDFLDQVAFVTMGKWLGLGLVLASVDEIDAVKKTWNFPRRGVTTELDVKEAFYSWNTVLAYLANTQNRRNQVLENLNVNEDDSWGVGIMIYAPVCRKGKINGTPFRFVPKLNDCAFEKIRVVRSPDWSKEATNKNVIVGGVKEWITFDYTASSSSPTSSPGLLSHCRAIIEGMNEFEVGDFSTPKEWATLHSNNEDKENNDTFNRALQDELGSKLINAKFVQRQLKTPQRVSCWVLLEGVISPLPRPKVNLKAVKKKQPRYIRSPLMALQHTRK
jgi:hypothetical protein